MAVLKELEQLREEKINKKLREDFGFYLYMLEEQIGRSNEMMEEAGRTLSKYGQQMVDMVKNGGEAVARIPEQYGLTDD